MSVRAPSSACAVLFAVLPVVSLQAAPQGGPPARAQRPPAMDAFLRRAAEPRSARATAPSTAAPGGVAGAPAAQRPAAAPVGFCAASLQDQAQPGTCLPASSLPALGALYPLGPEFFISPTGQVGVGTLAPAHALDVVGDLRGSQRLAVGNTAAIGFSAGYDRCFDLSSRISDFSSSNNWSPFNSHFLIQPPHDLTGPDDTYIYSHVLQVETEAGNDSDIAYLQGPYLGAWHRGTGDIPIFGSTVLSAQSDGGTITFQGAALASSVGSGSSSIKDNASLQVDASHVGFGGGIDRNYGVYVFRPVANSPIVDNYGLYLEDQSVAQGNNYALYSDGGDVFLRGRVGIGALPSTYALQVGMPGDGSEARANAWNVLSSREYKRDIEALEDSEYADIRAKIAAVDVVHYRYKDDDHRHLGVIAEDSPPEILSRDGAGVSLGDYAAFLLAGLKAQQSELDALRAELTDLRRQVEAR